MADPIEWLGGFIVGVVGDLIVDALQGVLVAQVAVAQDSMGAGTPGAALLGVIPLLMYVVPWIPLAGMAVWELLGSS